MTEDPGPPPLRLRDVREEDLPALFEHQLDPEATRMAAFPSRDREAFDAHWAKVLQDSSAITNVVLVEGRVVGNVLCFEQSGRHLLGYWIDRREWGRGIATRAVREFLTRVRRRPLHAFVAKHNAGSVRVLEKCGFVRCGEGVIPAEKAGTDGQPVEEYVYVLEE